MGLPSFTPGVLNTIWSRKRKAVVALFLFIVLWICLMGSKPRPITTRAGREWMYETDEFILNGTDVDPREVEQTTFKKANETDDKLNVMETSHVDLRVFEHTALKLTNVTDKRAFQTADVDLHNQDHTTLTHDQMESSHPNTTALIEIIKHRLYIFSAIQRIMTKLVDKVSFRYDLVLTGWLHNDERPVNYSCCAWMQNDEIISTRVYQTNQQDFDTTLEATEFLCSLTHASSIRSVSIATNGSTCPPQKPKFYAQLYKLGPEQPGLAVCSKIAYWGVDVKFLVEWFEIIRLLGVSKVISYTYELSDDAMKVLRYYEDIGLAENYAFNYPQIVWMPRQINEKRNQVYSDKAVAVYDCQERLANHRYVTIMDKDEIIVPVTDHLQGTLLHFIRTELQKDPNVGWMTFPTQMHHITGEPFAGNTMYTEHYHLCSKPIFDRFKNIYLPSRVVPGTVETHEMTAAKGYTRIMVSKRKATLHHYRKPRDNYLIYRSAHDAELETNKSCSIMRRLSDLVRDATTTTRIKLGLV